MISKNRDEEPMAKRRLLPWTIVASFLLHGVAYASLARPPAVAKPEPRKTQLRFDVVEKAKPEKIEPPAPPPPPPKPRSLAPPPAQKLAAAAPAPAPPLAPVASEGVTLAGDGSGNAFSMPLGNGGALEPARHRAPEPVNTPAPLLSRPAPAAPQPPLVPVSDLSSRPTPPALGTALERNYPADARRRGLSGTAKVRARIDPDGVVRRVTLVEESAAGFGGACSRTLTGSRWAAPKDKAGRSVATEIRYTCRFVVEP
jgi:TonB family protein